MIWLLVACTASDPELTAERAALDAYRRGRTLLEEGSAAEALGAFDEALAVRNADPILLGWRIQAQADSGDLEGAAESARALLATRPRFAEIRYNRAAHLARLGRLDEAGPELERAIADGASRTRSAMQDADFSGHLEHPAFDFLPEEVLLVAVDAPQGALFWGSEANLRFRVFGADGASVSIVAEQVSGPLSLVRVSEDVVESSEGLARDLAWTFRVEGPGESILGPFEIRSGSWSTRVDAIRFPSEAPPGRGSDAVHALALEVPSALPIDLELPGIRSDDAGLWVKRGPIDRTEITPRPERPPVLYTLKDRSQVKWVVERFAGTGSVKIRRAGDVVLEGP